MTQHPEPTSRRVLVIACGALARELREITALNGLHEVTVECLPARLHNRPQLIPAAVQQRLRAARDNYSTILVGYMDCGTGGELDRVCAAEGVTRLPGAHCYELFAGRAAFPALHEAELGTFYLTDYLARHFERLIMQGLGLIDHPELRDSYFAHYTRLLYLAQTDNPDLTERARHAADRLGLRYERIFTGYGDIAVQLSQVVERHRSSATAIVQSPTAVDSSLTGAVAADRVLGDRVRGDQVLVGAP